MADLLDEIEVVEPVYVPRAIVINLTADEGVMLEQLAVLWKLDPVQVVTQLLRRATPSLNGHGYEVRCDGCGLTFQSDRRPLPGKKHWCDNCRKTGEPAADRARRYRAKKGGQ